MSSAPSLESGPTAPPCSGTLHQQLLLVLEPCTRLPCRAEEQGRLGGGSARGWGRQAAEHRAQATHARAQATHARSKETQPHGLARASWEAGGPRPQDVPIEHRPKSTKWVRAEAAQPDGGELPGSYRWPHALGPLLQPRGEVALLGPPPAHPPARRRSTTARPPHAGSRPAPRDQCLPWCQCGPLQAQWH